MRQLTLNFSTLSPRMGRDRDDHARFSGQSITSDAESMCVSPRDSRLNSVTFIVPVRNEESSIADTLDQILGQHRGGLGVEILVVDGGSTDNTRAIVLDYANRRQEVRLYDNPKMLSSAARNIGIRESTGDCVVIVDGHCEIPTRTYLLDLVEAFEESGADCLGRPQPLDICNATAIQRAIAVARSSPLGHHPDSFIYTNQEVDCPAASVAVAYRRSIFEKIGNFDERFDACEDYEFNHRIDKAALKCRIVPKLTVKYQPRKSLRGLFRQLYRYGRGRVRLMRKHPDSFYVISKLPAVLVAIIAGPLICWAMPFLWTPYIFAMVVYLAIVFAGSFFEAIRKRDAKLLFWLPAAFVTIHLGAGTGIVIETLSGWGEEL